MKVRCINSEGYEDELTIGEIYDVIETIRSHYRIKNNLNKIYGYTVERFEIIEEKQKEPNSYDFINPDHYKNGDKEVYQEMIEIWGKEAFIKHCEITAFKYLKRLGKKPNNSISQDLQKAQWYLNKANELQNEN